MKRIGWIRSLVVGCIALGLGSSWADEGMFPLSELHRLGLAGKGLELGPNEIFNPDQISLVDGICRVNGCTGSFVSADGLIITNHHCAFEAIQNASSTDRDLLHDGFVSRTRSDEIPAPGYTVRITERYQDVSDAVLSAVQPEMEFLERTKAIERRRKELEQAAEKEHAGLRAEVAEMFAGKTYVLFLYTYLKDVRLVFAPPASIGNFGGEVDNWEWPRHTGDFSFMRAYTAPNGSSVAYSADNVPYKPKRFLQVNPAGVAENDFVFLLGYPGRTLRHKTASYLIYEQQIRLPATVELYSWQIREMEQASAADRAVAIKHSARIKSLANVEKRSRGQILGMNRTTIIEERQQAERDLQSFIDSDPSRREKYGNVLRDIDTVYEEMKRLSPLEINFRELRTACRALSFAYTIYEAAVERAKLDIEREPPYMDRNWDQTREQLLLNVKDWDRSTDQRVFAGMLARISTVPGFETLPALVEMVDEGDVPAQAADGLFDRTRLGDVEFVKNCLERNADELSQIDDPLLALLIRLYPKYVNLRDLEKAREGQLNQLYGSLIEAKQAFLIAEFVPDANSTLRLTHGRVRGYSPADAVYKSPITTLRGVIEKTTGAEPFITPQPVIDLYRAGRFGPFVDPSTNQVPVAILYDTDTTGGNSGSPVLNARGELVGVNFDRIFEATINDFAWNEAYSRSIGVDIRYVLWVAGIAYQSKNLLEEMGVADLHQ